MASSDGVRRLLFSSISVLRQFHCYSTKSSLKNVESSIGTNFMADYLIKSLGFSTQEAVSASTKVTRLKSTSNPDSVINLLKKYGLEQPQIREIVSYSPKILFCKADKTLEPKIRVVQELGLSGSDLVKLVKKCPNFFALGLSTQIIPVIDYLRGLLGSEENAAETINKSMWLFNVLTVKKLSESVLLLQNHGLSDEEIRQFIFKNNLRSLMQNPESLSIKLNWLEKRFGVAHGSTRFTRCLHSVAACSITMLEKKMEIFRSFGWSNGEISLLFTSQPYCFALGEDYIHNKLNFFMKELGYTPAYLLSCPTLLLYSFKKRVKPRYEVLKILKEKTLVDSRKPLITIAVFPEPKFKKFVQLFEKDIPGLYESYISSMK